MTVVNDVETKKDRKAETKAAPEPHAAEVAAFARPNFGAIAATWRRQLGSLLLNPLGYVFILVFVLASSAILFWPDSYFARKDRAVLLSTHILQEVEAIADHVLLVSEGRLRFDGSPGELAGSAGLEARFRELTKGVAA